MYLLTDIESICGFDRHKRKCYENKKKTQCRFCLHYLCHFGTNCWSKYIFFEFIYSVLYYPGVFHLGRPCHFPQPLCIFLWCVLCILWDTLAVENVAMSTLIYLWFVLFFCLCWYNKNAFNVIAFALSKANPVPD